MYGITGILGITLMIAPFIVGYLDNTTATWTSVILGGVVAALSVLEALRKEREKWEYWVAALFGVGIFLSPFILGFTGHIQALWTSMFMGFLIAITAGSKLYTGRVLK
jgi:hypothetical protein